MRFASIMKGLGVYMVDSVMTLISFLPVLTALSIHVEEFEVMSRDTQSIQLADDVLLIKNPDILE